MNRIALIIILGTLVLLTTGALVSCGETDGNGPGGVSFFGAGS